MPSVELLDVYDSQGNKTGKTVARGTPMGQGEYILAVDVWIRNDEGQYLISKRVPTLAVEPGRWQPTTGCVAAGEDSLSAALREAKEELGIVLHPQNGEILKRICVWGNLFVDIWLFRQNADIQEIVLQPSETADARWATGDFIWRLVESDAFLSKPRMPYIQSAAILPCEEK